MVFQLVLVPLKYLVLIRFSNLLDFLHLQVEHKHLSRLYLRSQVNYDSLSPDWNYLLRSFSFYYGMVSVDYPVVVRVGTVIEGADVN